MGCATRCPDLPGLAERWGVSVLHCPYCHGYELDRQPVGVLARSELVLHQAMLLPDWGPTMLFTQGALALASEQTAALAARGVGIEETPIAELIGKSPALEAVRLTDGGPYLWPGCSSRPTRLRVAILQNSWDAQWRQGRPGPYLKVDAQQATSVPGVFAAGDLASPMPNATLAAAAGVMAGGSAHRSLIFDADLAPVA